MQNAHNHLLQSSETTLASPSCCMDSSSSSESCDVVQWWMSQRHDMRNNSLTFLSRNKRWIIRRRLVVFVSKSFRSRNRRKSCRSCMMLFFSIPSDVTPCVVVFQCCCSPALALCTDRRHCHPSCVTSLKANDLFLYLFKYFFFGHWIRFNSFKTVRFFLF